MHTILIVALALEMFLVLFLFYALHDKFFLLIKVYFLMLFSKTYFSRLNVLNI